MSMKTSSLLTIIAFGALAACGGQTADVGTASDKEAVGPDDPNGSASSSVAGLGAPADAPSIFGVWRMVVPDGPVGVPDGQPAPPMEVDIRPDGVAYRSMCAGDPGKGVRCPAASTYECLAGTVAWDASVSHWRLTIVGIGYTEHTERRRSHPRNERRSPHRLHQSDVLRRSLRASVME